MKCFDLCTFDHILFGIANVFKPFMHYKTEHTTFHSYKNMLYLREVYSARLMNHFWCEFGLCVTKLSRSAFTDYSDLKYKTTEN